MASSKQIQLVIACVAAAALLGTASADYTETFTFTIYLHMRAAEVHKTVWEGALKGYVAETKGTRTADPSSELYATVGGLEYAVRWDTKLITDSATYIKFLDIGERGGRFTDSVLYLRGQFNKADITDHSSAIVGGTRGLAGAYGSGIYTAVAGSEGVWRIDGHFFIDY